MMGTDTTNKSDVQASAQKFCETPHGNTAASGTPSILLPPSEIPGTALAKRSVREVPVEGKIATLSGSPRTRADWMVWTASRCKLPGEASKLREFASEDYREAINEIFSRSNSAENPEKAKQNDAEQCAKNTEAEYEEIVKKAKQNNMEQFISNTQSLESSNIGQLNVSNLTKIAKGGFGTVYETTIGRENVIVKTNISGKNIKCDELGGVKYEQRVANQIREEAKKTIREGQDLLGVHQGAAFLCFPISEISANKRAAIVQKKIPGYDCWTGIIEKKAKFYSKGAPRNLSGATLLGTQVMMGIAAIHKNGYVHCDIKNENLMLDEKDPNHPVLKIIDFGSACKNGANHGTGTADLGAPELMESPSPIRTTAEDVYAAGLTLPTILFGGGEFSFSLSSEDSYSCEDIHIHRERKKEFDGWSRDEKVKFLTKKFTDQNECVKIRSGGDYPQGHIKVFANLIADMCAFNPSERPSAVDVVEVLQTLHLSAPDPESRAPSKSQWNDSVISDLVKNDDYGAYAKKLLSQAYEVSTRKLLSQALS
jgi:serine/threonine protein kinase